MQEYRCVRAKTLPYVGTRLCWPRDDYKYMDGRVSIPHDYKHVQSQTLLYASSTAD